MGQGPGFRGQVGKDLTAETCPEHRRKAAKSAE